MLIVRYNKLQYQLVAAMNTHTHIPPIHSWEHVPQLVQPP